MMNMLPTSISLIAAIGQGGFIRYQISTATTDKFIFKYFLKKLISSLQEFYKDIPYVIILDNARYHHSLITIEEVLRHVSYIYTPPYSPYLTVLKRCGLKLRK